jgi:hypothetical protein
MANRRRRQQGNVGRDDRGHGRLKLSYYVIMSIV